VFASCYFCVCIYSLSLFFISSTKTNRYRPYKLRSGSFTVCLSLQGMDQCSLSTRRTLPSGIVWLRSTCCPCARMSQLLAGDNCHLEFRFDLYTLRLRKNKTLDFRSQLRQDRFPKPFQRQTARKLSVSVSPLCCYTTVQNSNIRN